MNANFDKNVKCPVNEEIERLNKEIERLTNENSRYGASIVSLIIDKTRLIDDLTEIKEHPLYRLHAVYRRMTSMFRR
jgi:hypothetical protein